MFIDKRLVGPNLVRDKHLHDLTKANIVKKTSTSCKDDAHSQGLVDGRSHAESTDSIVDVKPSPK